MKATGIVRRIDDLGRVVIPKEIRRTLRIREADPLEIFTDREGEIILKQGVLNRKPDGVSTKAFDNIAKRIAGENVPAMDISDKYDCFKLSKKFVLKNE